MRILLNIRYTRDVHEPDILIPRRVHEDGSFNTYNLPNFYDRREIGGRTKRSVDPYVLHLVLPFNGIDHHVELTPYHEFISPEMVVETRSDGIGVVSNFNEALRFKRASDQQCHYRGIIRGHDNSRAALSLCDGVVRTYNIILLSCFFLFFLFLFIFFFTSILRIFPYL